MADLRYWSFSALDAMQHSPRFLNYTTERVRRHQRLKVAEESIILGRSGRINAVAVVASLLNL
jgi:hypothetical protein